MKIVLNDCYGGFSLSEEFISAYPQFEEFNYSNDARKRTNEEFLNALESFGLDKACGSCADLGFAYIPDDATDWILQEYDGMESICYVLNGKIKFTYAGDYKIFN